MHIDNNSDDRPESPKKHVSIAEMRYQIPERKPVRLLPWFMLMLALIASSGFLLQRDAWMDNRWLRSTVMNLGFHLQQRDKDWRIPANSVHPSWFTRSDDSKVLLIKGEVENLLSTSMLPPGIEVSFFSNQAPGQVIGTQRLNFTYPPSELVMLRTPYQTPNKDNIPIPALGKREFVFLLDSLPRSTADFTLAIKTQ